MVLTGRPKRKLVNNGTEAVVDELSYSAARLVTSSAHARMMRRRNRPDVRRR
jgi:hypothetical protein